MAAQLGANWHQMLLDKFAPHTDGVVSWRQDGEGYKRHFCVVGKAVHVEWTSGLGPLGPDTSVINFRSWFSASPTADLSSCRVSGSQLIAASNRALDSLYTMRSYIGIAGRAVNVVVYITHEDFGGVPKATFYAVGCKEIPFVEKPAAITVTNFWAEYLNEGAGHLWQTKDAEAVAMAAGICQDGTPGNVVIDYMMEQQTEFFDIWQTALVLDTLRESPKGGAKLGKGIK